MDIIVIPAYKPDEALIKITDQLWAYGCQIIVVDDGSGEEYQKIFDEVREICIVLVHSENNGKGAAIKTALSYISREMKNTDLIGIMDADGQHLPEDMIKLLTYARGQKNILALGVRDVGKKMPLRSRFGNRVTRTVFKALSGVKLTDTQTGLRAFRFELVTKMLSVEGERYEYEMNVLMAFAKADIPIHEIPIQTVYRDRENSSSHFRTVKDSARIYLDMIRFSLSSFSSFILDYLLFSLLIFFLPKTAVYVLLANVTARMISAFYNYSMNCRFVFHTNRKMGTVIRYFALAGFILIMNNLILEIFVQVFHMSVYPAKLLTECLLFVFSWVVQKYVIFRKDKMLCKES